jgi:uncharacterized protein
MNRRQFHRTALSAVATAVAATSYVGPVLAAEPAKKKPAGSYFDFHTHIGRVLTNTQLSASELLRWMDANDVAQAAVLPLTSPEASAYLVTTDFVLEQTKPYRDRLIPFCSIDPRTDYSGGERGLVEILSRWVEAGAKGFGEHKVGLAIDDPRNMKLYTACAEVKLPVLVHMDDVRNSDQLGLPGLAKVLAEFPTVNFLGHAIGWWASISGDVTQESRTKFPKTGAPIAAGGAIDALMDKYPNLYGDLSATAGAVAMSRDPKFAREFLIRRADRLVFGTDYYSVGQNIPQFEIYAQLDLPAEVQEKVFRQNAARLLGI